MYYTFNHKIFLRFKTSTESSWKLHFFFYLDEHYVTIPQYFHHF